MPRPESLDRRNEDDEDSEANRLDLKSDAVVTFHDRISMVVTFWQSTRNSNEVCTRCVYGEQR